MRQNQKLDISIGGKWALSWKIGVYAFPLLLLVVPVSENALTSWWAFWRWTLVSMISLIPVTLIFLAADITYFRNRHIKSVPNYYVFLLGFVLGLVRGLTAGVAAYYLNILEMTHFDAPGTIFLRGLNAGFIGMISLPLIAIVASSYEIYTSDRNALISERMLTESQKSESLAVIKSLRASMTRKVDENLLSVVINSQEYLDDKGKSLEESWELMAVRLRKAALDTIRPFSHLMHRRGEEKIYRVDIFELLRYVASSFRIETSWVLMIYLVSNFKILYSNAPGIYASLNLTTRLLLVYLGLTIFKKINRSGNKKGFFQYFITLVVFIGIFMVISHRLDHFFRLAHDSEYAHIIDGIWLLLVILIIGFVSSFLHGQSAESDFLERQISEQQLKAMILKREEERLSRELAKYLHGTIQSRLMASAMAIERAGRKGDKKQLERELAEAYKSLRIPSSEYFASPEGSLKEELNKVIAKWTGLMDVKIKISPKIPDIESQKIQEIGNVVNEGLSNSFRHGSATKISINISHSSNQIHIEINDNGEGPSGGKPGLGTDWFRAISGSAWSLSRNPTGSGATLKLSIQI